jgi:hypothetical protein
MLKLEELKGSKYLCSGYVKLIDGAVVHMKELLPVINLLQESNPRESGFYLHASDGRIIAWTQTEEACFAARRLLRPEPE